MQNSARGVGGWRGGRMEGRGGGVREGGCINRGKPTPAAAASLRAANGQRWSLVGVRKKLWKNAIYWETQIFFKFANPYLFFCLFSSLINVTIQNQIDKKRRWCAMDSNPGEAGWQAQTNPLSYGGTQIFLVSCFCVASQDRSLHLPPPLANWYKTMKVVDKVRNFLSLWTT